VHGKHSTAGTKNQEALTFDDVLLQPAHSLVLPNQVELNTQLTQDIALNIPLLSAAMDTVTDSRLAIAMAQEGGVGIIHKNMDITAQAAEVRRVKRYESGIVMEPITISPQTTIKEVRELTALHGISGLPVVDSSGLVGIVTKRDIRFEAREDEPVASIMTPREKLVTVKEHAPREEALDKLHENRIEKVLVVNDNFELKGMITVRDVRSARDYPTAGKDSHGRLVSGAAIGVGADSDDRTDALVEAGVDLLVVDTAHGHAQSVIERVKQTRERFPHVQIVAGNIATAAAAEALVAAGANSLKVGIGPGSICTTRIVAGVGVPQITAIDNVCRAVAGSGVPVIADGGIRYSGDIVKAIAAGASAVMVGGLFAGTEEAPGEVELYQGRSYKSYRGMGSVGAMQQGSSDRYFQDAESATRKLVPEGIEGRVPYKGPLSAVLHQLLGGLRSGMGYCGCESITALHDRATFVKVSNAGMRESHVHDVQITKEPPNYRLD